MYDSFKANPSDIVKISEKTGLKESIIKKIKEHLFHSVHSLEQGIQQFDPDIDIAHAWQRLIDGNFCQSDLRLLLHEYSEITIIEKTTTLYNTELNARLIHEIANKVHNWQDFV